MTSPITKEKIAFCLNSVAMTEMSLSQLRKVYIKVDNNSLAKQLRMMAHENATPIRVIHNSAGHLLGPAMTLGGVVIGYLGVRVFIPQPVSKVIQTFGGCNVVLGLIVMARDDESLYAGAKALVCVFKSNPFSQSEMEASNGYLSLVMLSSSWIHETETTNIGTGYNTENNKLPVPILSLMSTTKRETSHLI